MKATANVKGRGNARTSSCGAARAVCLRAGGSPMSRRGSILLTVMVVITLAALVGTTVLYRADAQRGSARNGMEHAQLRALAWSGVQGAMAELASQRGDLMQGGTPALTGEWSLYKGTVRGGIRLAPIGP